ncbi:cys/Met metabolism PLP-dependent enzyme family protein, partial [Vibrio parahaemolyticus V-223/04]
LFFSFWLPIGQPLKKLANFCFIV